MYNAFEILIDKHQIQETRLVVIQKRIHIYIQSIAAQRKCSQSKAYFTLDRILRV